jgi:site-specific DNA-methyltransferase (adenine-specific)
MEFDFEKAKNKVLCGDSRDILPNIPNESVDLIITSPPYFNQREYDNAGQYNKFSAKNTQDLIIGNESSVDKYLENIISIFKECVRVTKKTGSIVFNLGDKYQNGSLLLVPYRFALEATKIDNIKLINEVTWVKLNPTPKQAPKKLVPSTEPFFIFAKSDDYFFNKNGFLDLLDIINRNKNSKFSGSLGKKYYNLIEKSDLTKEQKLMAQYELAKVIKEVKTGKISGFRMKIKGIHSLPYGGNGGGRLMHIERDGFTIIKISGNALKRDIIESPVETLKGNIHPAVYPEFIIREFIKLLTKKGDLILDPFMGSGTTGIAAKKLERNYIGIEISKMYCDYAQSRIDKTKIDQNIESFI